MREWCAFQAVCHFTKREWALVSREMSGAETNAAPQFARKLLVDLSVMTVIGIVLAVIGPFGSAAAPVAVRLPIWIGFAWLGYVIYRPMGYLVGRLHRSLQLPQLGLWIGVTLIATIPMAIAVWMIGFLPEAPRWPTAQEALSAYINVLAIGASVTVIFFLIERGSQQTEASDTRAVDAVDAAPGDQPASVEAANRGSRFLDRLPPELGTQLIALEMEDHYVRAHTILGSDLVLMRLRDAVAELDGLDGMQIHRSWWVARHAVTGVKREGRNVRLVLESGLEAPVSRANVQPLKDAAWI